MSKLAEQVTDVRWVYAFGGGDSDGEASMKNLLGGKGANLAEMAKLGLPVLGYVRDTQNYVQIAAHGLTLWDVAKSRVEKDLEQWRPIVEWAERRAPKAEKTERAAKAS